MGNVYGYIRVSSTDQNEARQLVALRAAGILKSGSGRGSRRPRRAACGLAGR